MGLDHPDYGKSVTNLGLLYHNQGNYAKAEPLYLEAKRIFAKAFGIAHPAYLHIMGNISTLYYDKGEYDKAQVLNTEAKEIKLKLAGEETEQYAALLNNIGNLYNGSANYDQAELLYIESKDFKARLLGKEDPDYAITTGNLGILYYNKGDFTKAEALLLEAKEIQLKAEKVPAEYPSNLNTLAMVYKAKKEYSKAEALYLEAKEIWAKTLGTSHQFYATALYNLAYRYKAKGEYAKAETLYLEAKEIMKKALGENHPEYAAFLNGLASFYFEKGEYPKAEQLFLQAKAIQTKTLGKDHPDYAETTVNLALLYQKTNRIPEAAALFLESNKINRRIIEKASSYSSENEMLAFLRTFEEELARFQSITLLHPTPELCQENYNNALFNTGITLENDRILARAIAGADSLTRGIYEKWQGCHRRLAKRYARPIDERKKIAEVEAEAEGYEKLLRRSLPAFRQAPKVPTWQDVQTHLKPDEVAIAFLHFQYYKPEATDSTMYAAMLLRPGWKAPKLVQLLEEKQLDSLIHTTGELKSDYVMKLYSISDRGIIAVEKPTKTLYQLCWQPLEKELSGVKTVYFSPTGLLHRINLSAIPIPPQEGGQAGLDSTLADRYHLIELGSTRSLAASAETSIQNNQALLFGSIQFEMDSTALLASIARLNGSTVASPAAPAPANTNAPNRGGTWAYLKGTEKEVSTIESLLSADGMNIKTLKNYDATEEAFKKIGTQGESPRILHLATHGFFFPDLKGKAINTKESGFKTSENPLIRSGLLLAGANYAWAAGKPLKKGMENGILTAYEISHLNLSNTELVVLSACETGLGDIQGNEGVYGLQRAFKIAGVRYLIMSLWQVPDKQTSLLMTTFYKKWLDEKMELPEAFRAAQKLMRDNGLSPYDWAGFVLVE